MSLHETVGIILKTYNLAEADKIAVVLTPDRGLIRGVAKGAKRLKSRFGGSLEPFSEVGFEYYSKEDRELVSIRRLELINSRFESLSDPQSFKHFAYLAELLAELVPAHEPNERIYRMTKVCLETGVGNPEALEATTLYFELWLLKLGGYLPSWDRCDNCKRELTANEETSLQANFQLLCAVCRVNKTSQPITGEHRFIFKQAQKTSPEKFLATARDHFEAVREVSNVLKRIITHIVGKDLKTLKISAGAA